MNKKYSIELLDEIITIRYSERPEMDDIRQSMDETAGIARSGLRLWDFSNGAINLNNDQLQELADYGKMLFMPPSKAAIVAPEDLTYGLLRVYEVFRKQDLVEIEIFRTEQEAIDWLKNKNP